MQVIFRKADLDTVLTAIILDRVPGDEIVWRPDGATAEELADSEMRCIEAGGSGSTELMNAYGMADECIMTGV